jgi:hypothetical protein
MVDNEQIVADLANDTWAYYYSMGFNCEVIREVHRNASGKLFIRYPQWGLVPLTKDEPENLIGKVPTSLELTNRIRSIQKEFADQVIRLQEKLEAREELLIKFCLGDGDPFSGIKEALKKVIRNYEEKFIKEVKG